MVRLGLKDPTLEIMVTVSKHWAKRVLRAIEQRDRGELEGWRLARHDWARRRREVLERLDDLHLFACEYLNRLAVHGAPLFEIEMIEPAVERPSTSALPVGYLRLDMGDCHLSVRVSSAGFNATTVRLTDQNGLSLGYQFEIGLRAWVRRSRSLAA